MSLSSCSAACRLAMAPLLLTVIVSADDPPLTREYIRLGGRVIAIESTAASTSTGLSLSCGTTALGPNEHRTCTVPGYSNSQLTWQTPLVGYMASPGEYVAPGTVSASATVSIRATLTADPAKTAATGIAISPALSASTSVFASTGGSGSVQITRNTTWAVSAPSWITLISGYSGSEPALLVFSVTPNTSSSPRTGYLVLDAANSVLITQYGAGQAPCSVTLPQTSVTLAGGAQSGLTIAVTSACAWTVASTVPWINVLSATGYGNGTVTYSVTVNTASSSRSGELVIGNQTLTITQAASDFYELDPVHASLYMGGTQTFTLYKTTAGVRTPITSGITWSATAGYFTDNVYHAPYSGTDGQIVTVQAAYAGGGVTATVSLYIGVGGGTSIPVSVLPSSGAGAKQTFVLQYNSPSHWNGDFILASNTPGPCSVKLTPDSYSTTMYLRLYADDGYSFVGAVVLPPRYTYNWSAPLSNSQCTLDAMNGYWEALNSAGPVQYAIPLQFKASFAGQKSLLMRPFYWQDIAYLCGTWSILFGAPTLAIDSPAAGAALAGDVSITGWALDNASSAETAIQRIQVAVDGTVLPASYYGLPRTDVCATYPNRPGCPNVGYRAAWNTASVPNGTHIIRVTAYDTDNPANSSFVERTVSVNNSTGGQALKFTPGCTLLAAGYCTTTQPVGGWSVIQGSVDLVSAVLWPAWVPNGVVLDLTGSANATLRQPVATTAGQQYTLRFSYTYNPDGGTASGLRQGTLRINGANVLTLGPFDGSEGSVPLWRNASVPFTATSTTTTIEFVGTSNNSYNGIVLADNVVLYTGAL